MLKICVTIHYTTLEHRNYPTTEVSFIYWSTISADIMGPGYYEIPLSVQSLLMTCYGNCYAGMQKKNRTSLMIKCEHFRSLHLVFYNQWYRHSKFVLSYNRVGKFGMLDHLVIKSVVSFTLLPWVVQLYEVVASLPSQICIRYSSTTTSLFHA